MVEASKKVNEEKEMTQPYEAYRYSGSGPTGSVSVIGWMGIGDNVCMIPALAELAKTKKVTLYTERPEMFSMLPVKLIKLDKRHGTCSDGRILDPTWDEDELTRCEILYKISGELIWTWPASFSDLSPQERMALVFGVTIPDGFDYVSALNATKRNFGSLSLFVPRSTTDKRSMPEAIAETIFEALPSNYIRMSNDGKGWYAPTIQELINMIYSAEHVISVDTGVAHIAAALKVPLTVVGGFSDVVGYYSHYSGPVRIVRKDCKKDCTCKRNAECMSISRNEVLPFTKEP